jgi:hypothetical protein
MDRDYNAGFAECLEKTLSELTDCLRPVTWNGQGKNPSLLGEKPMTRHDIILTQTAVKERHQYGHT